MEGNLHGAGDIGKNNRISRGSLETGGERSGKKEGSHWEEEGRKVAEWDKGRKARWGKIEAGLVLTGAALLALTDLAP